MSPMQQFRVRDKLHRILKIVGATEKLYTTKQIISYLGKYIEQRKLYDVDNMRTVCCKGDPLEELFGVQVFTIANFKDIWKFVFPHLIPATNKEVEENEISNKNKLASSSNEGDLKNTKFDHQSVLQLPWWYFVEKDVKDVENHDKGTATGSLVTASTAYVVDTEDETGSGTNDSKFTNRDINEDRFSEEYEPDSEDSDTDATEPLESDDEQYPLLPRPVEDLNEETTTTTTDTTDVSMDYDMPLEDHWRCNECTTVNTPIVGYCQRCWKLRRGWLPDASMSSPSLMKSSTLPPADDYSELFTPTLTRSSSQPNPNVRGIDVADGRTNEKRSSSECREQGEMSCSGSNFNSLPFNTGKRKQDCPSDSKSIPACKIRNTSSYEDKNGSTSKNCENNALSSTSDSTVHEHLASKDAARYSVAVPGMCNICHNNPNDATIIHGRFAHQFCCYRCAKKLKKKGKTCPVCRQPIELVVKNYICQM